MSNARSGLVVMAGLSGILVLAAVGVCGELPQTGATPSAAGDAAGKVSFERDIQPIFKSACYQCHGPDRQKAKLRLDSRPLAMVGGRDGKIILPGNAEESALLKRLTD